MGRYHAKFINALNQKSYERAMKILEDSEYEYFYQYRAWDNYTEKNIREGNIILSNPMDFNDIFDLFYKVNWSELFLSKQDEDKKMKFLSLRKYMQDKIDEKERELTERFTVGIDEQKRNVFISCFSTKSDSVLMWGHYAKKYTGYCVEYKKEDIVRICRKNRDYFGEVNYVDSVIEINDNSNKREKINQASFTKYSDWAYEKEWRMFAVDSKRTRVNESIGKYGRIIESGIFPSKVLIGCKMEDDKKNKLKCWCENLKIEYVETRQSNDEYRIVEC